VLDKFEARNFTILAVNLEPAQREQVLPLMKALRVDFVPVESTWEWAEKEYNVLGTPANALVDQQGRIMFRPSVHDDATRRVLENEVEALLNRGS
jgi:hypothetical protein